MSRLDETLRPMVARLVDRAGTSVTLRRQSITAYDPVSGLVTQAVTDLSVSGVIEDVELGHPDGVVRRGDRMVTLAAEPLPSDPVPGDDLVVDGVVHRIISVSTTFAGDRPAAFRLHVRR